MAPLIWSRLSLACMLACASSAVAQDYRFAVPQMTLEVFVQPDASVRMVYDITFTNQAGAHVIDIVDIGTPHSGYRLTDVKASIAGEPIRDIRKSTYVDPGFEVHLGRHRIPAGQTRTLHVEFPMPDLVYQDTTRDDYASLRITPTWFGDQYVSGTGNIDVVVHILPGIQPDEVLHQGMPFSRKAVLGDDTHPLVIWHWPDVRPTGARLVGVSFPKRGLTRVISISRLQLFLKWYEESKNARMLVAGLFLLGFGILFFRFSGGTGKSLFLVLGAGTTAALYLNPPIDLFSFFPLAVLLYLNERKLRRRKRPYLPAIAETEGGGIKRGLTAPEASVLLELPIGKVLGLVIFGLLKKGIALRTQADPLAVAIEDAFALSCAGLDAGKLAETYKTAARSGKSAFQGSASRYYRSAAEANQTVIRLHEHPFLALLEANPAKPVSRIDFGPALKFLIEQVAQRMTGFDLSDTRDYYRSIVHRAVNEAKAIGDIEQRAKTIDRDLEWVLMGDDIGDVFEFGDFSYSPSWGPSRGGSSQGSGSSAPGGRTTIGDVGA